MFRKILPLLVAAILLPAAALAAPQDILTGWKVITPDLLGLRITPDLTEGENPSVRIDAKTPATIPVTALEVTGQRIEATEVTFSADIRTENLEGAAYLEMWIQVPGPGGGNFVSRGLERTARGTTGWSRYTTSFTLSRGQIARRILLNLVVAGKGSLWMRNVTLQRRP